MGTSKKEILLFLFSKELNVLEGVFSYVYFISIICKNKYIINISYVNRMFFNLIKYL